MSAIHPGIIAVQVQAAAKPKAPKPPKPPAGWPLQIHGTIYVTEQMRGIDADGVFASKYLPIRIGHVEFDYIGKSGKSLVYRLKPDVNFTVSLDTADAIIARNFEQENEVFDLFGPSGGLGEVGTFTVSGTLKVLPSRRHVVRRKVVFSPGEWDLDASVGMSYTYHHVVGYPASDTIMEGYEDIPIRGSGTTIEVTHKPRKAVEIHIIPPAYMFSDTTGDNPNARYIAKIDLSG